MVGVELNDQLRTQNYYIAASGSGKTYYLAEATSGSGVFVKPWDYTLVGCAVGDSPYRYPVIVVGPVVPLMITVLKVDSAKCVTRMTKALLLAVNE